MLDKYIVYQEGNPGTMMTPLAPLEVFCSYADGDVTFLDQLVRHLSVLQRENKISTWHRRQISAGKNWHEELDQHLNTAPLILLLVSANFLASDYQYGVELQRAMERHNANEARVIPILVSACDWTNAPFASLQSVPRNHRPLTQWSPRDAGFAEVAKEIRAALDELQNLTVGGAPTKLPKIWQVPYMRNPVFTGREDLLQELQSLLQIKQTATLSHPQIQSISGLGGVGKTQLVVEYAYRCASQYQAVFWVNAETQETLTSGYAGLAMTLNLPQKDEQDQQVIIQAVKRWLQMHRDWLLILDNIENPALLPALLPPSSGGHILLTTRSQVMGRIAHRLEIPTLTNDDGALLLLRRAGIIAPQGTLPDASAETIAQARQISKGLGDLPLALDQAGAYIDETECSLMRYQQQYQQRRIVLLARRGQLTSDYPQSVATTWSLSFEKIEQQAPLAAQILRFCSFLAPEGIPEALVNHALVSGLLADNLSEQAERIAQLISGELDELIAVLRAFSFIQRNSQESTLAIHRLVQAVLRDAMTEGERNTWAEQIVNLLQEHLPDPSFESWQRCEQYVPHAQVCILLAARSSLEKARVAFWIGAYLLERQRVQEAGWYVQHALQLREQHLGKDHVETAASLDRLAHWWVLQGRYGEAEPLYQRALTIRERQLGADHPSTAISLNNLAGLYESQGRYEEAEPLCQCALAIVEHQLGADHPTTATSLNNLAHLYQQQGRYGEAEPLYQQALTIVEHQLGADHPDTATSLNNLAHLYRQQGRYGEAEPLYQQALTIRERQLGADHPDTAISLNNLADLYQQQGHYGEAEPLYQQALTIQVCQLGADHPSTAISLNNLADLYQQQGRYGEAEPLHQRALAIVEHQLGADHPSTATSLNNLADLYRRQGRYSEAEPLYQRALAIVERQLGTDHLDTAISLNNLAGLYENQRRYGEAEPLLQRSLAIIERRLGACHPDTATSLNNLAHLYQQQGQYDEAEVLYQRALTISEQQLGADHPNTATTLDNLARLYYSQGKYNEAEPVLKRAYTIWLRCLGEDHLTTQTALRNHGTLLEAMGREKELNKLENDN